MASRKSPWASAHDDAVSAEAKALQKQGWDVAADVPGWPGPGTKNGRIPDIVATKRGSGRIVEVETERGDDETQHRRFMKHVAPKSNWTFHVVIAARDGRRIDRYDLTHGLKSLHG